MEQSVAVAVGRIYADQKADQCLLLAEAVDKVLTVICFETMIQNSENFRINNAAIKDCQIDCCVNFGGPDFFNTLG